MSNKRPAWKLTMNESFWYRAWCVVTFGGAKRQEAES